MFKCIQILVFCIIHSTLANYTTVPTSARTTLRTTTKRCDLKKRPEPVVVHQNETLKIAMSGRNLTRYDLNPDCPLEFWNWALAFVDLERVCLNMLLTRIKVKFEK